MNMQISHLKLRCRGGRLPLPAPLAALFRVSLLLRCNLHHKVCK